MNDKNVTYMNDKNVTYAWQIDCGNLGFKLDPRYCYATEKEAIKAFEQEYCLPWSKLKDYGLVPRRVKIMWADDDE